MVSVVLLFTVGMILGIAAVAVISSPYYGALGLVLAAGMGCGLLAAYEGSFLCLVLFLIYLGGMLVVFAYSSALAAEPFPEHMGSWKVGEGVLLYVGGLGLLFTMVEGDWFGSSLAMAGGLDKFVMFRVDTEGVAIMYSLGGSMLILSVWVLLVTLFSVLELTRGLVRGSIRAV